MTFRLGDLADVSGRLRAAGIPASFSAEKSKLFAAAADRLAREGRGEDTPVCAVFVPGRIEVLGKHTDYAGGRSLIAAAGHGFCTAAVPREDSLLRIFALQPDEHIEFELSGDLSPTPGSWANYPMTAARRIARNFRPPLVGSDVVFASDLPPAAGMSSSSALMVSTFMAISSINRLADRPEYTENIDSPEALAEYIATIENGQTFRGLIGDRGVGTFGGSEDHTAMLCCRTGLLSLYSFCPVRLERTVEMPGGYVFAIAASGVVAEKTGSAMEKYNRASGLALRAAELWREATGRDETNLAAICASGGDAVARMLDILAAAKDGKFKPEQLRNRFEQFFRENEEIIPAAVEALETGDIEAFGRLVDRSQAHSEKLLGNQVPQTVFLAAAARRLGASAASAFGAGFGGSAWAMVKSDEAETFLARWSRSYGEAFEAQAAEARFFTMCAGPGAFDLGKIRRKNRTATSASISPRDGGIYGDSIAAVRPDETGVRSMAEYASAPRVTVVGGGMITKIQLLPTICHLQREGFVGEIHVCALNAAPLAAMQSDKTLTRAFPGFQFVPHPDPAKVDPGEKFPDLYKDVLAEAPRGSIAVIAVPDQMHYPVLKEAIKNDLHVCVVKPLVLEYDQAEEIAAEAFERGLVVGVEYHKRFDYRNVMARQAYRAGRLGEFRLAQAQMIEPYYYRDSNFQNWCTCENSDMFTYVGCHYVDLIAFITGLRPVSVSVYGIVDNYPNGREGFLWTDARVIWENGASLNVVDAIGYPNAAAGGNAQGLAMWCQGDNDATLLVHSDQYRGVKHSYNSAGDEPGDTVYAEPNPDYFQLIDLGGGGLTPVGYGHRSAEYIIRACRQAGAIEDIAERRKLVKRFDDEGIMATPANSNYNELVIQAARKSILGGGREVLIDYGDQPAVRFRQYD